MNERKQRLFSWGQGEVDGENANEFNSSNISTTWLAACGKYTFPDAILLNVPLHTEYLQKIRLDILL